MVREVMIYSEKKGRLQRGAAPVGNYWVHEIKEALEELEKRKL